VLNSFLKNGRITPEPTTPTAIAKAVISAGVITTEISIPYVLYNHAPKIPIKAPIKRVMKLASISLMFICFLIK